MAVGSVSRWQVIRDVICNQKTGALILQMGQHYLQWHLQSGNIICVSSTLPEHSFAEFLLGNSDLAAEDVSEAQSLIDDQRSLGSVLLQMRVADAERIHDLLEQHWKRLSSFLLQSTNHLFWSPKQTPMKKHIVMADIPLSDLILTCDRSWIEIPSALRCVEQLPAPYRIVEVAETERALRDQEKRMLHYLKRGAKLAEILRDPELDRMTCYRVLFVLWLCGYLLPPQPAATTARENSVSPIWSRIRSIPPDWLIPLFPGVFIGVLLSPEPDNVATHQNVSPQFENLKEVIERPAWSSAAENKQKSNANEEDEK